MAKPTRSQQAKTRKKKITRTLPIIQPHAAGIDIGATEIWVAVPADRDEESVRSVEEEV